MYPPAGVEFGEHVCCAWGHSCDTAPQIKAGSMWEVVGNPYMRINISVLVSIIAQTTRNMSAECSCKDVLGV